MCTGTDACGKGFAETKFSKCVVDAKAAKKAKWDAFFSPGGPGATRVSDTKYICGGALATSAIKKLQKADPYAKLVCVIRIVQDGAFFDAITKKIEKEYANDLAGCAVGDSPQQQKWVPF